MKTKIYLISLIIAAIGMAACNQIVTQETEKELINLIYQSLDATPEQFAVSMSQHGFREATKSSQGITFVIEYNDYDDQVLGSMSNNGNQINRIIYERYLNKESNHAAYYKLFSDMMAEHGYTDWHGYFKDPATAKDIHDIIRWNDYSSGIEVANRQILCNHINNDNLLELDTWQYFLELFTYTHNDNSQWQGKIFVYTDQYFSAPNETDISGGSIKDIHLLFELQRKE